VPGSEGDFGVYPDHTPFITRLRPACCSASTARSKRALPCTTAL
jgi:F0F1-type ATP synthase epsilon subunit